MVARRVKATGKPVPEYRYAVVDINDFATYTSLESAKAELKNTLEDTVSTYCEYVVVKVVAEAIKSVVITEVA